MVMDARTLACRMFCPRGFGSLMHRCWNFSKISGRWLKAILPHLED